MAQGPSTSRESANPDGGIPSDEHDAAVSRWLRDEPLDLRKNDQFGVDQLVDRFVELLARAKPPFTVSLSGPWGVGKSTVATAIVDRLRERRIRAITIDAWTQDVQQLRRSVVIEVGAALAGGTDEDRRALAEELDEARATRIDVQSARIEARELGPTLRQVWRAWPAYLVLVSIVSVSLYGALTLDKDNGLRPILIALATVLGPILVASVAWRLVTPSTSRAAATVDFQLAKKFREVVTKRPGFFGYRRPVVVVLDNLDRLSGSDAITALGQIRALVEIETSRCIFFIPIDRGRLSAHLGRALGDPSAAADYLEKFFNLDVQLVQPEPIDLLDWAFGEAGKLFLDASEQERRSAAEIAVSAAARSPRTITRILNGAYTRYESLKPVPGMDLRQLVLVEGVVTIAPGLADRLAAEPRAFVQLRQQVAERNEAAAQIAIVVGYLGTGAAAPSDAVGDPSAEGAGNEYDVERMRRFLAANLDIPLTREQLRLAITLREDRFWKGVTEADAIKESLETGDADGFAIALQDRTPVDRSRAVERSVQYVIDTAAYRRVAVRALDAVVPEARQHDDFATRLHKAALQLLGDADHELLGSLSGQTVAFVFGEKQDAPGQSKTRATLVAAIKDPTTAITRSLVSAARYVADLIDATDLESLRQRFANETMDIQAPIFEDPPSVVLADGPVATALVTDLSAWTPEPGAHGDAVTAAERLTSLARAGWDLQDAAETLASTLDAQIAALTASTEDMALLDAITQLFATARPSAEFDQFGTDLAERQSIGDQEVLQYALRLPLQASALNSVGVEIQGWIETTGTPDQIASLLETRRNRVEEALPTLRAVLLDQWETENAIEYARLAVEGDPVQLGDLIAQWVALPATTCLSRAVEVLDLAADVGQRADVQAFIVAIVGRIPAIAFSDFSDLPAVGDWLVRRKFERESLAVALGARIRSATTSSEIQSISQPVITTAERFGGRQRASLAEALAEQYTTLNTGAPAQVAWLVEHLTAKATRERLTVQLIERGEPLAETLDAVGQAHSVFDSVQVFEALISRASREADESAAALGLEAAMNWQHPDPASTSDASANLDIVADRFPALQPTIDSLRT